MKNCTSVLTTKRKTRAKRIRSQSNPCFLQANQCKKRYRVLMGGAGSGKSYNIAQNLVIRMMCGQYRGANLLVIRKTENSHLNSTFAEMMSAIRRLCGEKWQRYWQLSRTPLKLRCRATGCTAIFQGINGPEQREKVKSIAFEKGKLCWIWCEEATELEEEDLETLDDRLRGKLEGELFYQITLTFNPVSAAHWLKKRFFEKQEETVFTHHSTYLDNEFLDEAFTRRMEERKKRDPGGYRIYGLGEWGETEGLILTNWQERTFPTNSENFDGMAIGQDFGFNHLNAILLLGWKDGDVYICKEICCSGRDTGQIIRLCEGKLPKETTMYCDSAEPDRIQQWKAAGYRARAAKKGPGSIRAQIDWLRSRRIYVHPDCEECIRELQNWKWDRDSTSGEFTDEPESTRDDAMAALRYGTEGWRKNGEVSF